MRCPQAAEWHAAAVAEITGLESMKTWSIADLPAGVRALPVKWVFKEKQKSDGTHSSYKARLVVKVFHQQHGVDYEDVFAPVGSAGALRAMTAMAARNGWVMRQIDFKQAFLNGDLSEVVC
jgi:hypothetical protein